MSDPPVEAAAGDKKNDGSRSSPRRDSRTSATPRSATTNSDKQRQQQQQQQREGYQKDKQQAGRNNNSGKDRRSSADAGDSSPKSPRSGGDGSGGSSPRQKRRSPNKIYRTPPTPEPEKLYVMERSFTLDCIAVNTTSNDYAKAKPKLGQVIPPYNAQKDKASDPYFEFKGVSRTLRLNGQAKPGTSIEGPVTDRFFESGAGFQYLYIRNKNGAGHSRDTIDGHGQFLTGLQPIDGYNGRFGYRRTSPSLRYVPSPFGVATNSPIH